MKKENKMIKVEIFKAKVELESSYKELKLLLKQKESVKYAAFKAENLQDRSAKEKVIDSLKLEDDEWMLQEENLLVKEGHLKTISLIVETLQNTLSAMHSHPEIGMDYFLELQEGYIKFIMESID